MKFKNVQICSTLISDSVDISNLIQKQKNKFEWQNCLVFKNLKNFRNNEKNSSIENAIFGGSYSIVI